VKRSSYQTLNYTIARSSSLLLRSAPSQGTLKMISLEEIVDSCKGKLRVLKVSTRFVTRSKSNDVSSQPHYSLVIVRAYLETLSCSAVTQLLLNYDKSGAPFFNLLCIIPLFAPTGELIYFVGGQTDVTGALGNGSRLQLPGRTPLPEEPNKSEIDLSAFSPIVQTSAAYAATANDANSIDESRSKSAQSQYQDTPKTNSDAVYHGSELLNGGGGGGGKEKSSSSHVRPRPFSKSSRTSFLGPKTWSTKPQPSTTITTTISDSDESPKLQYKQGTVERRVNEFQTTYEKLILVSRAGKSSLFHVLCSLPLFFHPRADLRLLRV